MRRSLQTVTGNRRIDGVVPGVIGHRAFPISELRTADPFVMLDHIGPDNVGLDFFVDGHFHPHRGFETLTMMFEGVMHHVDTSGFREDLVSGSTQNMVAGSGIQHGGDMAADPDSGVFHEVQLWVNMPAANKMQPPSISSAQPGDKPVLDRGDHSIEVITGTVAGQTSPLRTTHPTTVVRVQAAPSAAVEIPDLPVGGPVLLYVMQGGIAVEDRSVDTFETARFGDDGDVVAFVAGQDGADILVLAGRPIGEPVVLGGPYVMNTAEEIAQAEADFAAGLFDNVVLG